MNVPARVRASWAPPPALAPSEWAATYRHLPESSAARGSLWRNGTQPALAAIMDAAVEAGTREIVLVKAAQVGGSEVIANLLGYLIHLEPCPVLLAHPTFEGVREWMKETFDDVVRSTPELAARVRDRRAPRGEHQGESTLVHKRFPGGYLAGVGGNSPNAYARRSCRVVIADDASRLPPAVSEEGDPAQLLRARTATWPDALCIFCSTPTIRGDRVDAMYRRSDQRRFFLACGCGYEDHVTWNDPAHFRVAYDGDDPMTARLECPRCHARHDEETRRAMVSKGRWRPTREADEPGLVGFHLPATVSLLGDTRLSSLVAGWLAARKGGRESLRAFINTALGESWEDSSTVRIEPHTLLCRRESYGEGVEVPAEAAVITCGVDVQKRTLEAQVVAWGPAMERWVVLWTFVPGDPRQPETWALLEALLFEQRYRHASGLDLPVHATCIDTGFLPDPVYDFALRFAHRRVFPTKGSSQERHGEPLVGKKSERTYGRNSRPVPLYMLNPAAGKAEIFAALALSGPGPGALHFPETVTEEYFAQVTGEHRETYYRHGVAHERWVQDRANHALDTLVLARAAFTIMSSGRHDGLVRDFARKLASERRAG